MVFPEIIARLKESIWIMSLNPPNTKLVSCWTVLLTVGALILQEDILLSKPKDFQAFHYSVGLPMH